MVRAKSIEMHVENAKGSMKIERFRASILLAFGCPMPLGDLNDWRNPYVHDLHELKKSQSTRRLVD